MSGANEHDAPVLADEDERTVIVDRGDDEDERTVIVDRGDDEDERTVIVDRGDDEDERTVVVDRGDDEDERTVIVDRADDGSPGSPDDGADDGTAVVDRQQSSLDDGTFVVDRAAHDLEQPLFRPPAPAREKTPLVRRGRRALRPAPLDPALVRTSIEAPGPGAVAPYGPRALPTPAAPPAQLAPTAAATRVVDGSLLSVEGEARRMSLIAVGAVVAASAISVAGLATLAILLAG
ncbi:hypothetical protein [Leifsonia sp. Root60]|uniref:hypothetical protein n=1 Tax=Leifsonia sp. Root60 TaxID=1736567 RepID=UPI0006FB2D10|nr:hypothetical protein [Leifsonia sp. Root60]KQX05456.1 hypothetical protein ASC59_15135 [Leifsonia sp. Root1293]KRA09089.1 hypothetical protein ASD61_15130 [Leifsonia sp. Root60]